MSRDHLKPPGRRADGGATIADVARHAGVSTTAVSYVLNGRSRQVSEATRERVLQAVRETSYRPNALARGLARQRTRTIGLILDARAAGTFLPIVRGLTTAARGADCTVLVATAEDGEDEEAAVDTFLGHQVAGVVALSFSGPHAAEALERLTREGIPVVSVNREVPGGDGVYWDNHGGARMATEHLLAMGHRRLAFVSRAGRMAAGEQLMGAVAERIAGFSAAIDAAPGATGLVVEPEHRDVAGMLDALRGLLTLAEGRRPTGLVCFNDALGALALRAAHEGGLRVPQDVAVTGFDDGEIAALATPPLTSVALPAQEAGRRAIALLLRRMGEPRAAPARELLPCRLIVRESTGAARH